MGKPGLGRVLPLRSRVMLPIPVLCSHCIKMRICYSRTFRISSSEASKFLKNEFSFTSAGLSSFMSSAPGSIWTVWERRRSLHTSRVRPRTTLLEVHTSCDGVDLGISGSNVFLLFLKDRVKETSPNLIWALRIIKLIFFIAFISS
jgi:hypothetical protein